MTNNRLTPEETEVFAKARQWWSYRTAQNLKHLANAIRDWIRADNQQAAA
jgi:hypothetical protein